MTSFHFTSGAPSQQLLSDMAALNTWPAESMPALSELLLAFLSQAPHQDERLAKFGALYTGRRASAVLA